MNITAAFLKYMTWAATAHLATLIEPFPSSDLHWDFFHIAYPVLDGWLLFYGFSRCCCYGCSGVVVVRNLRKIPAKTSHAKQMATHSKSGKLLHSSHTIHEKKMFASSHDKYSWWWWSDGDGQTAKESPIFMTFNNNWISQTGISRMMVCLLGIWHRPQSRHYWRVTKEE